MTDNPSTPDLIDELADEFVSRKQSGDSPAITEYCERYPDLAEEIRELFPTLAMLENVKPPTHPDDPTDAELPDQVEHYRIAREIGRGGMGVVYEAVDETLDRRVALKVLPRRLSIDGKAIARFQREGRAVANLHHTNIVPLFEVGNDDGRFFLAMQLIIGRSLDRVIADASSAGPGSTKDNNPLTVVAERPGVDGRMGESPPASLSSSDSTIGGLGGRHGIRSVARIGVQVAEALAHAHARRIIHRDVKPANILLDENETVWLTDFGLAKADGDDLTHSGEFVGTLRYMAPERFRGQCDARSDVYGLGLTLYELLTLRTPFDHSDRLELIYAIANTEPASPRSLNPYIPRDLETIVLRAIHKEPEARYPTAKALAEDLKRFVDDRPITSRRHSLAEQTIRWSRRNKSLAAALTGIAVLLVTMIVVLAVTNSREKGLRVAAEDSEASKTAALAKSREAQRREEVARKASDADRTKLTNALRLVEARDVELNRNLYASQINLVGQSLRSAAGTNQLLEVIDRWKSPFQTSDSQIDFRGWEWYYLYSSTLEDVVTINGLSMWSADWSPDNSQIAVAGVVGPLVSSNIYIHDASTGQLVRTLKGHESGVAFVDWDRVNNRIASASSDKTIRIWNPVTGDCERIIGPFSSTVCFVAWDGKGTQLAFMTNKAGHAADGHLVHVLNLESPDDEPLTLEATDVDLYHRAVWSPDGQRLMGGGGFAMVMWDVASTKIVKGPIQATGFEWEPEGHEVRRYLVCEESGDIHLLDSSLKKRIRTFRGLKARALKPQIIADGTLVIAGSMDNTVRVWDATNGDPIEVFQRHQSSVSSVSPSPAGDRVVTGSPDKFGVHVWPLRADNLKWFDVPLALDVNWHPDNRHLAVTSGENACLVLDVDAGEIVSRKSETATCCAWSSDGKSIALGGEQLRIWDREFANATEHHPGKVIGNVCWHPTQPWCLYSAKSEICVYFQDKVQTMLVTRMDKYQFSGVAWHTRDPNILTVAFQGVITALDFTLTKQRQIFRGHTSFVRHLAWSPDGRLLASGSDDGTVRIWDFESGKELFRLRNHNNTINGVCWSPDGDRLATCGDDGVVRIWDPTTGLEVLSLRDLEAAVSSVDWSPDGKRIAACSRRGKVIVWDASAAYGLPEPEKGPTDSTAPAKVVWAEEPKLSRPPKIVPVLISPDWKWSEAESLGDGVNSPHGEFEPTLSADGLTIVFASDRPGGQGGSDLWMSVRKSPSDPWLPAQNLSAPINAEGNEESPELSNDALTLYFASDRRDGDLDLWSSSRPTVDDAWSEPKLVPNVNSDKADLEPAVSADGRTLVFASTRAPKVGIFDLWMSRRATTSDSWSEPRHLNALINGYDWQGSPSLSSDEFGSVLVFDTAIGPRVAARSFANTLFTWSQAVWVDEHIQSMGSPCLSKDGMSIYFRQLSEAGDYDLYVTRRVKR